MLDRPRENAMLGVDVEKCRWPGVSFIDCAGESTSGRRTTWRQAGGEFEVKAGGDMGP